MNGLQVVEYNLVPGRVRTLMGQWQEERGLLEVGAQARISGYDSMKVQTRDRVNPAARTGPGAASWDSIARLGMKDALKGCVVAKRGPLTAKREDEIHAEAYAFAQTMVMPDLAAAADDGERGAKVTPTTAASFTAYAPEQYRAIGRREASDAVSATAYGIHTVQAALGGPIDAPVQPEPPVLAVSGKLAATANVGTYRNPTAHYTTDVPITYYSARAAEGVLYGKTAVRNASQPFARTAAFTNPVEEGHKAHGGFQETAKHGEVTTLGTASRLGVTTNAHGNGGAKGSPAATATFAAGLGGTAALWRTGGATKAGLTGLVSTRAPGAELALGLLFTKLLRRIAEAAANPAAPAPSPAAAAGTRGAPAGIGLGAIGAAAGRSLGTRVPPGTARPHPSALSPDALLQGARRGVTAFLADLRQHADQEAGLGLGLEAEVVGAQAARAALHAATGAALPGKEAEAVLAACDADASTRVSLGQLLALMRDTLPPSRKAAVADVFAAAAEGGEVAAPHALVALAEPAGEEAVQSLLRFCVEVGVEDGVTFDAFLTYVAGLAAHCNTDEDVKRLLKAEFPGAF